MNRNLSVPTTLTALALALPGLLLGCKKDEEEAQPSAFLDDASVAIGVDVQSSLGQAPHSAIARAVNTHGAAVSADPMQITVGGAATSVAFDSTGYGGVSQAEAGSSVIEGAERPASVHAVDVDWPGVGLLGAAEAPGTATEVWPATGGMLVRGASTVWFVSPDRGAHPVLTFPDGALTAGMRTGHLDSDGVLDAVVWGGDTVVMLRGRTGGGMSWGAGVQAEGKTAAGAAMGDVSGDGAPDVVIPWADPEGNHRMQVLEGDGLWGLEGAIPTVMSSQPVDVAIGDNAATGMQQITVLLDNGGWTRYIGNGERRYMETGPNLDLDFPAQSRVESGWDINGDNGDELVFYGPYSPGAKREVWVYDLVGSSAWYLRLETSGAMFNRADVDNDALAEIFMLYEDQELVMLTWDGSDYRQKKVSTVTDHAPMGVHDVSGDRVPDVLLAGDAWTWWWGATETDDNGVVWWEGPEVLIEEFSLGLTGPIGRAELDGDVTTLEVVTFRNEGGATLLETWDVTPGAPASLSKRGAVTVSSTGAEGIDLAVCDGIAWALTETTLLRVDLTRATPTITGSTDTSGTRVDCGDGPSGSKAALLIGTNAYLYDASVSTVGDLVAVGTAQDVAIVDLGDGATVVGCTTTGCTVTRWEIGDGLQGYAIGAANSVTIVTADGEDERLGGGVVSTGDLDGDGNEDLLALSDEGFVAVYRSTGAGYGPGEFFHTTEPIVGPLVVGDADGDGWDDLWAATASGGLRATYAPEDAFLDSEDGGDTGDTGR